MFQFLLGRFLMKSFVIVWRTDDGRHFWKNVGADRDISKVYEYWQARIVSTIVLVIERDTFNQILSDKLQFNKLEESRA